MRILLTGCAGYIGSVLTAKLLGLGHHVVGIDSLMYDNGFAIAPYIGYPNFEFYQVDVQNDHTVSVLAKKCDAVILLAALVGAPLCDKGEHTRSWARSVNSWAIANLLQRLSPHQRVLFPNTNSGYGSTDGATPCTEDDHLKPISTYGVTKCEAEKYVLEHKNSVSLRLATVFGVSPRMRMDLMVNDFVMRLWRAQVLKENCEITDRLTVFEPHFQRNFVGIHDVCRAFVWMLTQQDLCGVYNLGLPGANLTKLELAYKVCDVLNIDLSLVKTGDGRDPDQRNYLVSNEKISKTGFFFQQPLEQGINDVATYCDLMGERHVRSHKVRNI